MNSPGQQPTGPSNHWITDLTEAFKETILDHDINKMKHFNQLYSKVTGESPDFFKYDHTELIELVEIATKRTATNNQIPTPNLPNQPGEHFLSTLWVVGIFPDSNYLEKRGSGIPDQPIHVGPTYLP